MYCCFSQDEPEQAHLDYARALLMVARHGDQLTRRFFVQRYAETIGGYAAYLLHLEDRDLQATFQDATRAKNGVWPSTLVGLRLAVPRRVEEELPDPWRTWRDLADYVPGGLEVDPVCHMFVDPADASYVIVREDRVIYFCCEGCRDTFEVQGRQDVAFLCLGNDLGSSA